MCNSGDIFFFLSFFFRNKSSFVLSLFFFFLLFNYKMLQHCSFIHAYILYYENMGDHNKQSTNAAMKYSHSVNPILLQDQMRLAMNFSCSAYFPAGWTTARADINVETALHHPNTMIHHARLLSTLVEMLFGIAWFQWVFRRQKLNIGIGFCYFTFLIRTEDLLWCEEKLVYC